MKTALHRSAKKSLVQKLFFEYTQIAKSLHQCLRKRWMLVVSSLVIAIAMVLPGLFFLAFENVQQLADKWSNGLSIHVFLKNHVDKKSALALQSRLADDERVRDVSVILANQALDEFAEHSSLGAVMKQLAINPLPHSLQIYPHDTRDEARLDSLLEDVAKHEEIAQLQFDKNWIRTFHHVVELLNVATALFFQLLLIGLFVLIGHNISLLITQKVGEIHVLKLIGATDNFVTRPFVYLGMWFGCIGGLLAAVILLLACWLVREPVQGLVTLYESDFVLRVFSVWEYLLIIAVPSLVGMLAAFVSCRTIIARVSPDYEKAQEGYFQY